MRDILHKVREVVQGRGKIILITEQVEDKDCVSHVRKEFVYVAKEVDSEQGPCAPQVHIEKSFDSKARNEDFAFRVRGFFHVYRNRRLVKVGYCHTLRIRLHWKSKLASPKKSVTMA